jgi:hypothetical protein
MHRISKIGVVLAVALLVAGLAAPASAKKGGKPGPPSGTGLEVTVEPSSTFMWANSVGDEILFDITVTNTSGNDLYVTVAFSKDGEALGTWDASSEGTAVLQKNDTWSEVYTYHAEDVDLNGPSNEQNPVTAGTAVANGWLDEPVGNTPSDASDTADAVMTAYPIPECPIDSDSVIRFAPDEYLECSFTAEPNSYWLLTTTLQRMPHGKNLQPVATVRDGVPGNWCMDGDPVIDGVTVTQTAYFPADGVCLQGGAGGDTIPVRNSNTFYLAAWAGNSVEAEPCTTSGCP